MKLRAPLEIDLLLFIKSGKFDFIKLGQSKEWIINNFPDPDDYCVEIYKRDIWHYGNIEFHYNGDDPLSLIFSDYIDTLNGGKSLNLNKWIFEKPETLTLGNVITHLNKERISFKLLYCASSTGFVSSVIEIIESNVKMSFTPEENTDENFDEYLLRCKNEDSNFFILRSLSLHE